MATTANANAGGTSKQVPQQHPSHPAVIRVAPDPLNPVPAPYKGCNFSPRIRSYLLEWLLTVIVLVVPLALAYLFIPFRARSISLLDASIQQPYYVGDSLPILSVFIPTVIVPIICFIAYPLALSKYSARMGLPPHPFSFHYTYWWSACLVQTVGLTVLLSELMKRLIQAPRPDFLWRCFPGGIPAEVQARAVLNNYIVNTDQCQPEDNSVYEDGLQSLPSEHTSLAFCMTTVLILFFWTLRREMVAHAARIGRQGRCNQRDALIARLVASGVPRGRARKLAAGHSSAGSSSATCGGSGSNRSPVRDPCASPELRPPTLVEDLEPSPAPSPTPLPHHREKHGAAASSSSAIAAVPTEVQVPSDNRAALASGVHAGAGAGISGGSVLTPEAAPSPAVVSFWPHSHVVYIAHILLPVGWAISVGLSRTFDHKHAFMDVLLGGFLGILVALAVFRLHLIKFEGYHRRWNGHLEREQAEMDQKAAADANATREGLLHGYDIDEAERMHDEENQLQQAQHSPIQVHFDREAFEPASAKTTGDAASSSVQLAQPRPRAMLSAHPQPSMSTEFTDDASSAAAVPAEKHASHQPHLLQVPSRTQSRDHNSMDARRGSFSNDIAGGGGVQPAAE